MRQTDYIIVEASNPIELRTLVRELQDKSYEPQGGVMIVYHGSGKSGFLYAQAMVLKD